MCPVRCVTYVSGRSVFAVREGQIEGPSVCGIDNYRVVACIGWNKSPDIMLLLC